MCEAWIYAEWILVFKEKYCPTYKYPIFCRHIISIFQTLFYDTSRTLRLKAMLRENEAGKVCDLHSHWARPPSWSSSFRRERASALTGIKSLFSLFTCTTFSSLPLSLSLALSLFLQSQFALPADFPSVGPNSMAPVH